MDQFQTVFLCEGCFFTGCNKLELCIKAWASWLKTTAERGEDEVWEHDDLQERGASGLARMVSSKLPI